MTPPSVPAQGPGSAPGQMPAVAADRPVLDAYGLTQPGLPDAREALYRVSPGAAEQIWAALLHEAGLTGIETGETALKAIIHAMTGYGDPVIVLCARALSIRVSSYQHLAATQQIVRSTP